VQEDGCDGRWRRRRASGRLRGLAAGPRAPPSEGQNEGGKELVLAVQGVYMGRAGLAATAPNIPLCKLYILILLKNVFHK
jgi:hypothetical protein